MKVLSFGAIFNLSGFLGITANLARREDYAFTIIPHICCLLDLLRRHNSTFLIQKVSLWEFGLLAAGAFNLFE
jgi:hypothetical protein